MKIAEIPKSERPREKAMRFGISILSDYELLALIINVGTKNKNVLEIASGLLTKYGGLIGVSKLSYENLIMIEGLNKVNALKLIAIFEMFNRLKPKYYSSIKDELNDELLFQKYRYLSLSNQENLYLIVANKNKHICYEKLMYVGTKNKLLSSLSEIIKIVLQEKGKYFYIIHNHPNNDTSISMDDLIFTEDIQKQAKKFDLKLINHMVISENDYKLIIK